MTNIYDEFFKIPAFQKLYIETIHFMNTYQPIVIFNTLSLGKCCFKIRSRL
jgi:hypothetical protein